MHTHVPCPVMNYLPCCPSQNKLQASLLQATGNVQQAKGEEVFDSKLNKVRTWPQLGMLLMRIWLWT